MAYDLLVRGFADFSRLEDVLDQQTISRDPLSGVLDGVNTVFHTNYFPILTSGSLGVYINNTLSAGTANYDTGEVTLSSAPVAQPTASYIFTPYTAKQVSRFTIQGFMEMESRWTRGWQLLDGSGAWADENSSQVYILNSSGSDPVCGATVFSNSRVQVGFFILCCEYRFLAAQYRHHARTGYMWRSGSHGMMVDKSKVAGNINLAMDEMNDQLIAGMQQAQIQFYPNGDQFGGIIANPVTVDYASNFEWQTGAKENDNWSLEGYNVAYRPLTYFP